MVPAAIHRMKAKHHKKHPARKPATQVMEAPGPPVYMDQNHDESRENGFDPAVARALGMKR